jgi:hypothetical protein
MLFKLYGVKIASIEEKMAFVKNISGISMVQQQCGLLQMTIGTVQTVKEGDTVSRYADVDIAMKHAIKMDWSVQKYVSEVDLISSVNPNVAPVVRCKDCRWWDKKDGSTYGYCTACKHGYVSEHWEIGIYRTYKGDWYCADGEKVTE